VTLRLKREELLYDITNCAYVEADIMDVKEEHLRHPVYDIGEDGNVDRVTRVMDIAFDECVEMLYPYSKREMDCEVALQLPETFSQTSVDLLAKLVHERMVCRVLADWLSITDKAAAREWAEKAETAEESIRSTVNMRRGRIRRRLSPW
jgi:energy-converting hydrogenase A subunit M